MNSSAKSYDDKDFPDDDLYYPSKEQEARMDKNFSEYREKELCSSGLRSLEDVLSEEEFHDLEQYLVFPLYHLVDFEGEKPTVFKDFRQAIKATVMAAGAIRSREKSTEFHLRSAIQDAGKAETKFLIFCFISVMLLILLLGKW